MADEQGSVVVVAGSDGGVLGVNTYSAWGVNGGTRLGRFGYTGQAYLVEAGLYHYKARIYSPTLGRFLQPDPVGTADDLNLYAYVGNDPVNDADSTGMGADRGGDWVKQNVLRGGSFYDAFLAEPVNDISYLAQNPGKLPGAVSDVSAAFPMAAAANPVRFGGAAASLIGTGYPKSVRLGYQGSVALIGPIGRGAVKFGVPIESVARSAVSVRNALKTAFRLISPPSAVARFEARSVNRYGNPLSWTADRFYLKYGSWEKVLEKASTTGGKDLGL